MPGASSAFGLLPPPLWGRGGEGGDAVMHQRCLTQRPPPLTPPHSRLRACPLPANLKRHQTPAGRGLVGEGEHSEFVATLIPHAASSGGEGAHRVRGASQLPTTAASTRARASAPRRAGRRTSRPPPCRGS